MSASLVSKTQHNTELAVITTPRTGGGYKGSTMNRLFVALTVLTLLLGTVSFAAPASAGPANQFPPASNEGGGNN